MATSLTLVNDSISNECYIAVDGQKCATLDPAGITANIVGNVVGNVTGSLSSGGAITMQTAQQASSNNNFDFNDIPDWVKRITIMFNGISTIGSSGIRVKLGTIGGLVEIGYSGIFFITNAVTTSSASSFSDGFDTVIYGFELQNMTGAFVLQKIDDANNWIISGNNCQDGYSATITGSVPVGDTLTRIRVTTVGGTDTFDAGTINISYEG